MDEFEVSGRRNNELRRDPEEDPYQVQTGGAGDSEPTDDYLYWNLPDALPALERVKHILAAPCIANRCTDLTIFINHTPVEDLCGCYAFIVESVFGWNCSLGWSLKTMARDSPTSNTQGVLSLLGSQGPIIGMAYRLMSDPNLFFEFPISCLPVSLERRVLRNEMPSFIASKIEKPEIMNLNLSTPKLRLNAFEFFFFHYAFVELGTTVEMTQHVSGWAAVTETVYSNLLDDYLNFFFPCSGFGVPPIQFTPRPVDSATFMMAPANRRNPLVNENGNERPKLFKASMYQDESLFRETGIQSTIPTRQKEIWRTETLLNIFVNMWLSIESSDNGPYQFETILPSVDLVKSVRTLVRHLHYFMNCVAAKTNHPLEEIRRSGFPVFQKKVYLLLRYLFTRWPLDNSFRIVYETWLSYIQPWRYINPGQVPAAEHEELLLEGRFHTFILDNILSYSYLFQQVLPRLLRTDLTSIRNAHMLYRIAKVYTGIESLKRTLLDIERNLAYEPLTPKLLHPSSSLSSGISIGSIHSHYISSADVSIPRTSSLSSTGQITQHEPSSLVRTISSSRHPVEFAASGLKLASIKQLMKELEGPDFTYVSLFSIASKEKISALLSLITDSLACLNEKPLEPVVPLSRLQRVTSWIFGLEKDAITLNAQKKTQQHERGRVIYFLENSRSYLAKLADLPYTEPTLLSDSELESTLGNTFENSATAMDSNRLDFNMDTGGKGVLRRGQIVQSMLQCKGNPDLEPARRHEVRILILILQKVSRFLNKFVVPRVHNIYYEDSYKGRFCRAVLARPLYYMHQAREEVGGNKSRVQKYLPPRINLRPLGTQNLPYQMFACCMVLAFIGVRGWGWAYIPFLMLLIYIVLKASFEPISHIDDLRNEFASESVTRSVVFPVRLNDSNPPDPLGS